MKRLVVFALVLAVVALAAAPTQAQRQPGGFGGGSDPLSLLTQKSVQEELKLTADQVKTVAELAEKNRGSFRDFQNLSREEAQKKREERNKANEKALADVLKADQLKRVKQIALQQRGPQAFADPEVADALKLTNEQKDKIKTINEDVQKEMRGLFQGGNFQEARTKMEALRKEAGEKLMKLLTDDQKAKWKELTGEPFKGEIRRGGFGGRPPEGGTPRRPIRP